MTSVPASAETGDQWMEKNGVNFWEGGGKRTKGLRSALRIPEVRSAALRRQGKRSPETTRCTGTGRGRSIFAPPHPPKLRSPPRCPCRFRSGRNMGTPGTDSGKKGTPARFSPSGGLDRPPKYYDLSVGQIVLRVNRIQSALSDCSAANKLPII